MSEVPQRRMDSGDSHPDPDKIRHRIFSILESNLLFGGGCGRGRGRVRVLSVDAGAATEGFLAAAALSRLESLLRSLSGDPSSHLADFFDLAAGSGAGGVLVSLLFSRGPDGRPLRSAADALHILASDQRHHLAGPGRGPFMWRRRRRQRWADVLEGLTLRDTVRPVLVPCHDAATGAPFVFSRADAVETGGYDFRLRDVCAASVGAWQRVRSVDGRTAIAPSLDGGAATANPAVVAVTHVLNNKVEFPAAERVEDLFLVSVGNGEGGGRSGAEARKKKNADIIRIAGDGISDTVDQAIAMAFGSSRETSYVRIQGRELKSQKTRDASNSSELLRMAEEMLEQRSVESVLFCGKKLSEKTNMEKLEWAAQELIKEHERRKKCPIPIVSFKQRHTSSSTSTSSSPPSSP